MLSELSKMSLAELGDEAAQAAFLITDMKSSAHDSLDAILTELHRRDEAYRELWKAARAGLVIIMAEFNEGGEDMSRVKCYQAEADALRTALSKIKAFHGE